MELKATVETLKKNGAKIIRPVMICVVVVLIVKLLLGK